MRLWMGQPEAMPLRSVPVWQNGTPQSMQRAPCSRSLAGSRCKWNSFQSRMRSTAVRASGNSRRDSIKPVGLPIQSERRDGKRQEKRRDAESAEERRNSERKRQFLSAYLCNLCVSALKSSFILITSCSDAEGAGRWELIFSQVIHDPEDPI